jgi:hypothetical protein
MAPKWSTGRRIKIKSDLRVGFKMEEWQTVMAGLICKLNTNWEFPKKNVYCMKLRPRVVMCVFTFVCAYDVSNYVYINVFIYAWCMYIQNITKFLLSHQYTFPVMCLLTPRVHVCVLVCTLGPSPGPTKLLIKSWIYEVVGHAVVQLVEALRYKLEGRGFDSR